MRTLSRTLQAAALGRTAGADAECAAGSGDEPVGGGGERAAGAVHGSDRAGLSLIAIVVGGLMFAFGEGGSKRTLAGIIFGLGMAMGAANFLAWLF